MCRPILKETGFMQQCIWRNFGLKVPDEWELLQFSRNTEKGRCAFADRYRHRLELDWRLVEGPPDTDRMLSDYLVRLADEGMQDGKRSNRSGWSGIVGSQDGQTFSRFGKHMPNEGCLVELVFIWPEERDADIEKSVLQSFREVAAEDDGRRRWRAFGMDFLAPAQTVLQGCTVQAAMAEMTFSEQHGRTVARFGRRGLVNDWQRGSMDAWLSRWVFGDMTVQTHRHTADAKGHDIHRVEGPQKIKGLLRKHPPCLAEAWLCPSDKRLYSWFGLASPNQTAEGRPLHCCGKGDHGDR
jgi:hypothetical protein